MTTLAWHSSAFADADSPAFLLINKLWLFNCFCQQSTWSNCLIAFVIVTINALVSYHHQNRIIQLSSNHHIFVMNPIHFLAHIIIISLDNNVGHHHHLVTIIIVWHLCRCWLWSRFTNLAMASDLTVCPAWSDSASPGHRGQSTWSWQVRSGWERVRSGNYVMSIEITLWSYFHSSLCRRM